MLSRHIDYNILHLPFTRVVHTYLYSNYKLRGKALKKAAFSIEKTRFNRFTTKLADHIMKLV